MASWTSVPCSLLKLVAVLTLDRTPGRGVGRRSEATAARGICGQHSPSCRNLERDLGDAVLEVVVTARKVEIEAHPVLEPAARAARNGRPRRAETLVELHVHHEVGHRRVRGDGLEQRV